MHALLHKEHISSAQIIIFGFALVILLGTFALMLPISAQNNTSTAFLDCLFTATSAVCVTGLVVFDTATHWSVFGQTVIMLLIQIGGMGVITVAAAFTIISGKKISLKQRSTIQDAVSAHHVGGIVRFTGFILKGTILFELLGALILMTVFVPKYGEDGIRTAIFLSISAFCNAGFDLEGTNVPYSSLTAYADNPIVNITIMLLVIIGGIGFLTWRDICENGIRIHRYHLQSKVIFAVTIPLILFPAIYFFFFEYAYLPLPTRLWGSLFQAVSPRTAGFNTLDITTLSETGQMITCMLMIIGGSPGSTAGGIKTTTFAVLISCAVSVFEKKENVHFFGRRIANETVKKALALFLLYIALFFTGGMVISQTESLPLMTCLFECASAVGTVGLTLGITPALGTVSRLILIVLMFLGRVGGLTLIFATLPVVKNTQSQLPLETIIIG